MWHVDRYGLALTAGADAVSAYNRGIGHLLRLERGAVEAVASAVAFDPTFALGHAALALLGHEFCAPVDVASRLRDARLHARRSTERERSHVHAVDRHLAGDSAPLVRHLERYPADALLLSVAVPTIAFAGVTTVPEQAWRIVERCGPAYGNDWWYAGLLAFMRQEQGRFDEAMDLSRASLAAEPAAGHSAHARAHAHYETADHAAGLAWMDDWITGDGARADSLTHFSWHAALHELSTGDLDAVRRRYDAQLRPTPDMGCRSLVDSGSLLWRWALTPGCGAVPGIDEVLAQVDDELLRCPPTPFMGLHAAVALCAAGDASGLAALARSCAGDDDPTQVEVTAPWPGRCAGSCSARPRAPRTTWPRSPRGCGASAGATPSARWSRRPGSARCSGPAGTTTRSRWSTAVSTVGTAAGTSGSAPRRPQGRRWPAELRRRGSCRP